MKIGLFGLPLSGKTTVFQALSGQKMPEDKQKKTDNYKAVVKVPDERLDVIYKYYPSAKKVNATIEYVEITGIQGKKNERGIPDSILGKMHSVDTLAHVVRTFDAEGIRHSHGSVDYRRDIMDINAELIFSDLAMVENGLEKLERTLKAGKKTELLQKREVLLKCKQALEQEQPLRCLQFSSDEQTVINSCQFLSQKPLMIILNIGEDQNSSELLEKTKTLGLPQTLITAICGKLEMEISQLEDDEQLLFLDGIGLKEPAMNRFIRESFQLLNLILFFTIGDDEVRAWTLAKDSPVIKAAGAIHSDLERGFIRAEVFHYLDFLQADGSEALLKKTGKIRLEGKDYIVQDGDIIYVRFNLNKQK